MSLVFRQRLLRFTTGLTGFEQVLLLVLLVLNNFIEISTLIKRNLNFKCEVKSHKVRLQAYCNKPLLKWICHAYDVTSTRREVATRLLSKRCTCSRHLVTVAPPKVNIWLFVKIRALRANPTLGGLTPDILSKKCTCCPNLVIIIPLEVNYIIMVLRMLKNYSVVSIFFRMTEV